MKLKKILNIIKENHVATINNVRGGVLFSNGENVYFAKDMPSIYSAEEFGAIFEIDGDELSAFVVSIDDSTSNADSLMNIERGISLEKVGSFSFGGLRCVLYKKANTRQLSFEESEEGFETDLSGYVAIDPDMLSPIRDGIISFEYISFLEKGAICAFENGVPVAVIRPKEISAESIELLAEVCEGLRAYYAG